MLLESSLKFITKRLSIFYQQAGMAFVECQDISEENNQIIFNLTSYGNTTGEYIDINFGGAYEDYQGVPHTITGVIHVKRDN